MLDKIKSNCYSQCIVTVQTHSFIGLKPKYDSTFLTHKSSHTPSAMPLNYASALDFTTTGCFLLLQVTRFPPTKVKYPEVDLLSSFELAQSASMYPSTYKFP